MKKIIIEPNQVQRNLPILSKNQENRILTYQLSVEGTSKIVSKCKKFGIAVPSALFAAYFGA